MNILITGVSSSLGLKVAALGKRKGFRIVGSVRSSRLPFSSKFVDSLVTLDLEDPRSFKNIVGPFDSIIHVAALSVGSPSELMLATGVGSFHLLERAKFLGVRSLVHVSAVSVYGRDPRGIVAEETPLRHSSPYGAAKWAAECYLSDPESGVNCVSVRCPAILVKEDSFHLLARLRTKMKDEHLIELSNPDFKFNNFITIDNLAAFLIDLSVSTPKGYVAFPVGSKDPLPFSELVNRLRTEFGFSGDIVWKKGTSSHFQIDLSKAEKYGFVPLSVLEGLDWWFKVLEN